MANYIELCENRGKKIGKQIGLVILKEKHDLIRSNYSFCYYNLLKILILQQNQPLSPNQARRIRNSNPWLQSGLIEMKFLLESN